MRSCWSVRRFAGLRCWNQRLWQHWQVQTRSGHKQSSQIAGWTVMDVRFCVRRTALMLASEANGVSVVELLVQRGADLSAVDSQGHDVGHYAKLPGSTEGRAALAAALNRQLISGKSRVIQCNRAPLVEKPVFGLSILGSCTAETWQSINLKMLIDAGSLSFIDQHSSQRFDLVRISCFTPLLEFRPHELVVRSMFPQCSASVWLTVVLLWFEHTVNTAI